MWWIRLHDVNGEEIMVNAYRISRMTPRDKQLGTTIDIPDRRFDVRESMLEIARMIPAAYK